MGGVVVRERHAMTRTQPLKRVYCIRLTSNWIAVKERKVGREKKKEEEENDGKFCGLFLKFSIFCYFKNDQTYHF